MSAVTESVVEAAALAWLAGLGYTVRHGSEIAVGAPDAERRDPGYRDVVLEGRLRWALGRLNPDLPSEALSAGSGFHFAFPALPPAPEVPEQLLDARRHQRRAIPARPVVDPPPAG